MEVGVLTDKKLNESKDKVGGFSLVTDMLEYQVEAKTSIWTVVLKYFWTVVLKYFWTVDWVVLKYFWTVDWVVLKYFWTVVLK